MDFVLTAQLLGNFGEFVGAIAVVVTLGYLVVQVSQNTKALKTTIQTDWVAISSDVHKIGAGNPALYGQLYWERDRSFSDLSPEEKAAHFHFWHHTMNTYECVYLAYLDGAVDESLFNARMRNIEWYFDNTPLNKQTWDHTAENVFDKRFFDFVNNTILRTSESN